MDAASSLTIVAIPAAEDPVWKVSSEKVPHLTICFLGDQSDNPNLGRMAEFLEHASKSLPPFGLSVDRRGLLGDQDADVLFFDVPQNSQIRNFRSHLLAQGDIFEAYLSISQYSSWTPHLTMGYPETPAKPDKREYPGFHWVNFDRIALWTGDYEGPEFQLKPHGYGGEIRMNDKAVDDVLAHFGVKGMKWGVTRSHPAVSLARDHGDKVRDALKIGGKDAEDASSVRDLKKKARKGGVRTLTDAELKKLVKRVELEDKYRKIADADKAATKKFIADIIGAVGKEVLSEVIKGAFRRKSSNSGGGSTRATIFQGRVIEGSTRSLSR
jgi:2'-5' RNA ligase